MKLVGLRKLYDFADRQPESRKPLMTWAYFVSQAEWESPMDIRKTHGSVSFMGGKRAVFNIKGNRYRLDVKVSYKNQVVQIIHIGTHAEYDLWRF